MDTIIRPKRLFIILIFVLAGFDSFAQIFGPEQIPQGNFGTIATMGKNGDGGIGQNIYPTVNGIGTNIPIYYQPASLVFHNGNLVPLNVNPTVTVGMPLVNKTSYQWGATEVWETDPYYFPNNSNQNSYQSIPHAPNNGYYLVVTSTSGMYNFPTLNTNDWFTIYDKYETNTLAPTNYFLVSNADSDPTKIFYKEKVKIIPGQLYRMGVDVARLNRNGVPPNVSFIISTKESDLTTIAPVFTTGTLDVENGAWKNFYFDYVAPCAGDSTVYVAFRNLNSGGNGNDLALDNLSMKAIVPLVTSNVDGNNCHVSFTIEGSVPGALTSFEYQWQIRKGNEFVDLPGATSRTYSTDSAGVFRIVIYTSSTISCPMYSNQVVVNKTDDGCLDVNRPNAIDDDYILYVGKSVSGNILDNDITSDPQSVSHDQLSVVSFEVNGQKYSAEMTAIVYGTDGTTQVGTLFIGRDGTLIAQGSLNGGDFPVITYTIAEENGGGDTANIIITVNRYMFTLDASCTCCPVDLSTTAPDISSAYNYYLYKGDDLAVTGTVSGNTLDFNWIESQSGIILFTFKRKAVGDQNLETLLDIPVFVAPTSTKWAPNTVKQSDDWNETLNWISESGTGFPIWCTDVVIPGDAYYFPTLRYPGLEACRDITFKDSASVGRIHWLAYRKAFVETSAVRGDWMMRSAPLKYMYSADYHADPSWGDGAAINPPIYMRYFDVKYTDNSGSIGNPDGTRGISVGNFSKAFANLKEKLNLAAGFVLRVDPGSNDHFSGTYKFPRLNADGSEVQFKYHYTNTGVWVEDGDPVNPQYYPFRFTDSGQPGRGTATPLTDAEWNWDSNSQGEDSRYRFIYESGSTVDPFTVTVSNAGTTNIIGNPFMSYLDFDEFYESNSDKIQPYYRIWNGSSFYSYIVGSVGIDGGAWTGLPTGTINEGVRLIAPMQAFFIDMTAGNDQLTFEPDSISVSGRHPSLLPRSAEVINNLLRLYVGMGNDQNSAIIAVLPLASDQYNPKEDVYKLFSFEDSIPEIYTISEGKAIEINALDINGPEKVIPLGVKTSQKGKVRLSWEGIESFTAFRNIILSDLVTQKKYDLKDTKDFIFDKTSTENVEGRFYLIMNNDIVTGIDQNQNENSIRAFSDHETITISSPLHEISGIELYDVAGRLQCRYSDLNTLYYNFKPSVTSGVFILKVTTLFEQKTFKIKI